MWQVVGHDWVVRVLDNSIVNERVSHAYLFTGAPNVGKSTLALALARALNCQAPGKPCHECDSCRRIAQGVHPDVHVVDLGYQALLREEDEEDQRELRIDTMRSITQQASLKPFEGQRKVYVVQDADSMTSQAANSLLKTLEEPPPHVVLVLTARDARLLLPTIVSRCQVFALRLVPVSLIESALQRHGVEEERAKLLARLSGGRIGWAIQAARDDSVLTHREYALRELSALPKMGRLDRLEYAQRLARSRDKIRETLGLWLGWWRDLLVIKGGSPDTIGNIDAAASLEQDSHRYGLSEIVAFVNAIRRTQRWLDMNVDSRLALEVLLLDLPVAES